MLRVLAAQAPVQGSSTAGAAVTSRLQHPPPAALVCCAAALLLLAAVAAASRWQPHPDTLAALLPQAAAGRALPSLASMAAAVVVDWQARSR